MNYSMIPMNRPLENPEHTDFVAYPINRSNGPIKSRVMQNRKSADQAIGPHPIVRKPSLFILVVVHDIKLLKTCVVRFAL